MIRAVIFDMDGVLIDARDWHYEALNTALEIFGYSISQDEHIKRFDGLPTSTKLNILSEERGLPRELHPIINRLKQSYTVDEVILKCRPKFNHEYLLARLKTEGFGLSVASNSIRSTVELMMQRSNLLQHLDFYLSNEDVREAKPSPEIYLKAIDNHGVSPDEVLVVEDNEHGVRSATEAGAHVMVVSDPGEVTYWNIMTKLQEIQAGRKL